MDAAKLEEGQPGSGRGFRCDDGAGQIRGARRGAWRYVDEFWLELQYNRSADCHVEIGINCSAPQPGTSEGLGEFLGSTETRVQKYRHEDYARARTTTITRVTEVRAKRARGPPPPQCGRCNCCEGWRMVAEYLRNNVTDARVLGLIPRMPDRYMDGEEGVAEEIIVVD